MQEKFQFQIPNSILILHFVAIFVPFLLQSSAATRRHSVIRRRKGPSMAEDFAKAVEEGLKLSKRIYVGKDRALFPPDSPSPMERSAQWLLPSAPMAYAVIVDPGIVDNPDMASYQPYVHGNCDPPALIPLQMNGIEMEVDCCLDTAFVRVSGSWRIHCVMGSRACDCVVAVPMGEQGSILGVEVAHARKASATELITLEDAEDIKVEAKPDEAAFLKPHIFTLTISQIDGGSILSIKLRWSQKLMFHDGQFTLCVPFTFPAYVNPIIQNLSKKEKIYLNVNSGSGAKINFKNKSHALKKLQHDVGLAFQYEAEVVSWSSTDFSFSYTVSSANISGTVLLQSPPVHDCDQREMFCIYLLPGTQQITKMAGKDVVFVVDISGSMVGKPVEDTKTALFVALQSLESNDSFNIIAFNDEIYQFSSSMEAATQEAIEKATQWIGENFVAGGHTNTSMSLNKAVELLPCTSGSIPIIFFVTDGTVEKERHICETMKSHVTDKAPTSPRICTFGIGKFCNHYFLRMLATLSRGQYDAAYDLDSIEPRMQNLFHRGLSAVLTNIVVDSLNSVDEIEMYPSCIPDLSSEGPSTICGRYQGKFPDSLTVKGVLGDRSDFVSNLKVEKAKDVLLEKIISKQQIDLLTAQAWFTEDKQLDEKAARISVLTGNLSEYTRMMIVEINKIHRPEESGAPKMTKAGTKKFGHTPSKKIGAAARVLNSASNRISASEKILDFGSTKEILLPRVSVGFGDLAKTADNTPLNREELESSEGSSEDSVQTDSNCCGAICGPTLGSVCCLQCCAGEASAEKPVSQKPELEKPVSQKL